jgi:hypothetical protein
MLLAMALVDLALAHELFREYRQNRAGISRKPEMASVCLICGSVHIEPDPRDGRKLVCRNCGFAFYRYRCVSCGSTIDSRDPSNPLCSDCHERKCTCGNCSCCQLSNGPD